MLEKLVIRRSWNKIGAEFERAKQDLAYLDNHLDVEPYSKAFYLTDCTKLTNIINRLLATKKSIFALIDKIMGHYPTNEASDKVEKICDEVKFLEKAVECCKSQLDRKQDIYEPDKLVKKMKQKIRLDGGIDTVPVTERERTPKSKQYDEMHSAVASFDAFSFDIEEYSFVSTLSVP